MPSTVGWRFHFVKEFLLLTGFVIALSCGSPSDKSSRESQNKPNLPGPSVTPQQFAEDVNAVRLVSTAIEPNKLNLTSNDLKTKKNPKGDGIFVYVPQTEFFGFERYVIWMVVDAKAYALNSPSKMVTPSLPWPKEADEAAWNKTGINKYNAASEAIGIVFGE